MFSAGVASAAPPEPTLTPVLNPGQQNSTADDFQSSCGNIPQAVPKGSVGWVFVLGGNEAEFLTLTLQFKDAKGNPVTVTIPNGAYPSGIITDNGTSKAWVIVPSGWTLVNGSATVDVATTQNFQVTHTCTGTATPSPSTSPTPSKSSGTSTPPSSGSSTPGGNLPLTGPAIGGIVLTGIAALGGGIALLVLRRRRDKVDFASE